MEYPFPMVKVVEVGEAALLAMAVEVEVVAAEVLVAVAVVAQQYLEQETILLLSPRVVVEAGVVQLMMLISPTINVWK